MEVLLVPGLLLNLLTIPVQNTLVFYNALLQNKVKAETHIYAGGGHGFGLSNSTTYDYWFDRLRNGWIPMVG